MGMDRGFGGNASPVLLHMVERWHFTGPDRIGNAVTITYPVVLKEPWRRAIISGRVIPAEERRESAGQLRSGKVAAPRPGRGRRQ